jgi:hypothetical protein
VKSSRQWVIYSAIRVGLFAVPLALLLWLQVNFYIAAIGAAVIGFCISYLFFRGQRDEVAKSIVRIRSSKEHDADSDLENEALDRRDNGTR